VRTVRAIRPGAGFAARTRVFVTHINSQTRGPTFYLVRQLRADGIAADMDDEGRSLKAQKRSAPTRKPGGGTP